MAFLLVESLAKNKSRFVQMSCKIMELLLLSVGLISMVAVMKDSLRDFVFSTFTGFWAFITCMCCFSSPPIIIIAINLMVLLIFASSTFYPRRDPHHEEVTILDVDDDDLQLKIAHRESPPAPAPAPRDVVLEVTPSAPPLPPPQLPPTQQPLDVETSPSRKTNPSATLQRGGRFDASQLPSPKPLPPSSPSRGKAAIPMRNNSTTLRRRRDDVSATQPQPQLPPPSPSLEKWKDPQPPPLEKWKDVVIESEEDDRRTNGEDTMEATWEAITGKKQQMKKKRPAKKKQSSPWVGVDVDVPPRVVRRLDSEEVVPSSPKWKELRKAETFNDAVSLTRRGGLIRKVPSMSLEDFNHKVEAFISGFNNTLRSTQKSKRSFFDIINQKRH